MRLKSKFVMMSLLALTIFSIILLSFNISFRHKEKGEQLAYIKWLYVEEKKEQLDDLKSIGQSVVREVKKKDISLIEKKDEITKQLEGIRFNDGEGYFGAYELRGKDVYFLFHGVNKKLNGQKADLDILDNSGKRFRRSIIENSYIEEITLYKYLNPISNDVEDKFVISFYDKDLDIIIFTGFYTNTLEERLIEFENKFVSIDEKILKDFSLLSLFLTLVIGLFTALASNKITNPIEELSSSIHDFSQGKLDTRVEVKTDDEISDLSNSFNNLAERLEVSISEREYLIERIDMLLMTTINLFNHQNESEFLWSIFHLVFDFIPEVDYAYGHFIYEDMNELLFANENKMSKVEYTEKEIKEINIEKDLEKICNEYPNYKISAEKLLSSKIMSLELKSKSKKYGEIKLFITDKNKEYPNNVDKLLGHFYALVDMFLSMSEVNEEFLDSYRNFAIKLALVAEAHDAETGKHVLRVGTLARYLSKMLRLPQESIDKIGNFAPLHDIGKIFIPTELLTKTGKLTEEEWNLLKTHTTQASKILGGDEKFAVAYNIAKYHHERWDGSGYPYNLKEEEIPVEARIVSIVDVYDALRSNRPYKRAYTHKEALDVILYGDGRTEPWHFDPVILNLFRDYNEKIEEIWEKI